MKKMHRIAPSVACALAAVIPAVAIGQQAVDGGSGEGIIEEIIVTAQKRSERLQDVPATIVAVSRDDLVSKGITNTIDLTKAVPGLVVQGATWYAMPIIRGVVTPTPGPNVELPTAVYLDGLYLQAPEGAFFNLPDVEQIEVLKGPQGTLAGLNAEAGAIFIRTREPSDTLTGNLSVDAGVYSASSGSSTGSIQGFISAPLASNVSASLAAGYRNDEGYLRQQQTDDVLDGGWSTFVRSKLLWEPTERLGFLASGYYVKEVPTSTAVYTTLNCEYASPVTYSTCLPVKSGYIQATEPHFAENLQEGFSLRSTLDLDVGSFTWLNGYTRNDFGGQFDNDGTAIDVPFNNFTAFSDTTTKSSELNFSSRDFGGLSFIAGAVYYYASMGYDPLLINTTGLGPWPISITTRFRTRSLGIYAEANYQLTDRLTLIAGQRYTRQNKKQDDVEDADHTWNEWTPRLSAQYSVSDSVTTYLTYSTGFKGGTYASTGMSPVVASPETLTSYEVGVKVATPTLRINASAFYYELEDYQANISVNQPDGTIVSLLQNAGSARMEGLDFDVKYQVGPRLQLTGAISYLPTAKFEHFPNASIYAPAATVEPTPTTTGVVRVNNVDLRGERLPIAPKLTLNAGVHYTQNTGIGSMTYGLFVYRTSDYGLDLGNYYAAPEHTLFDARIDLDRDNFTYSIWGRNLTNADSIRTFQQSGPGPIVSWGKPREVGITVSFNL